jgi:REP element-mobilizing transposase RayT
MWEIFEDYLFGLHHFHNADIFAYAMMPNHTHMLTRFPEDNMGFAMNLYQRDTSLEINHLLGRINQNYGDRYKPILIESSEQLDIVYRYIYQNPVRAGICKSIYDYPYSTINKVFGRVRSAIPITVDPISEELHFKKECRDWLETLPGEVEQRMIKQCMSKRVFRLPIQTSSRTQVPIARAPFSKKTDASA